MDGIIRIDKPSQMTSFGVVARVRRQLTEIAGKKVKVGHTGTLDPFATGLMIIVVGEACKQASGFSKLDKTYEATIRLGMQSTTGDPEGELTGVSDSQPDSQTVEAGLADFVGEIQQIPPAFSAIKIDGQRAYKLARKGEKVDIPARKVTVYSLELLDYTYPEIQIRAHVSSGTYIRALAEDVGAKLGTGAYCSELRRVTVGEYTLDKAHSPEDITEAVIEPLT